ncbi:type II toxin-antitoxin system VapC family toxin [Glycomyces xiaoerkulensis]|uniref:type II toxin-antitoxin system VapC family toxin n=1 Tax=Glycomyces xiaoerkulensis TaxID=2038139 RepID=UPI000C25CD72|nr:type II toxin-antitoxin system VapC family toxin [Glycomyces xiaoerkulensis]
MIVIDSSLLVEALSSDDGRSHRARTLLSEDPAWHAPDHLSVEVTSAIRGRVLGKKITLERAEFALATLREMPIVHSSWHEIADRAWSLRDNMTPYDAAFIALAERLDCPVVTTDRKLADCPLRRCEVQVID